jgi:hypothetical protein
MYTIMIVSQSTKLRLLLYDHRVIGLGNCFLSGLKY